MSNQVGNISFASRSKGYAAGIDHEEVVSRPNNLLSTTVFVTLVINLLAVACSGPQGNVIEGETIIVSTDLAADEFVFAELSDLYAEAVELFQEGEYESSLRRLAFIIEYIDEDDDYVRAAHYTSGLCYQRLDDWESAADAFSTVVQLWPGSRDATDALYLWAEARAQLGDWEGVVPLMERVLRRSRLTLLDRVEANLRLANAAIEIRDYAYAEQHYRAAIELDREARVTATDDDETLIDNHPLIAQANFGLGRTYHELFLEIRLVLPQEAVYRALVDKAQLMEQARLAYLDAVRMAHPYWSVAAGFMIGQIYEDFFLDVLACEVPHEFDRFTLEVYFEELREFLQPVVERSLTFYEHNLGMAQRLGAHHVWVTETVDGIERVQSYLYDPEVQDEQEQAILEQRHPHSAQDPQRRWSPPMGEE